MTMRVERHVVKQNFVVSLCIIIR